MVAQVDLVNSSAVFQNLDMGEQTEQTGKPRKRRRWLIAAVLLMAVSSVTWWNWPRGDARFVGKWRIYNGDATEPDGVLELRAGGLAVFDFGSDGSESVLWEATNTEFLLGNEASGSVTDLANTASQVVYQWTSHQIYFGDGVDRYRIISVTPDEILLKDEDNDSMRLQRVR